MKELIFIVVVIWLISMINFGAILWSIWVLIKCVVGFFILGAIVLKLIKLTD